MLLSNLMVQRLRSAPVEGPTLDVEKDAAFAVAICRDLLSGGQELCHHHGNSDGIGD